MGCFKVSSVCLQVAKFEVSVGIIWSDFDGTMVEFGCFGGVLLSIVQASHADECGCIFGFRLQGSRVAVCGFGVVALRLKVVALSDEDFWFDV